MELCTNQFNIKGLLLPIQYSDKEPNFKSNYKHSFT